MIFAIDSILIGASLIIILGLIGYVQPRVISPIDNLITNEKTVIFSINNGESILIDDNPEFSSPEQVYIRDNALITLKPGVYYWKIKKDNINEIRKLTIVSKVDLKIIKAGDIYNLVNGGNTRLNVEVYDNQTQINKFELSVLEDKTTNGTKFIGTQNEI